MSVKLIPGKPAVTRTVVEIIEPAGENKIQIEFSEHEAHILLSLLGKCNSWYFDGVYKELELILGIDERYDSAFKIIPSIDLYSISPKLQDIAKG